MDLPGSLARSLLDGLPLGVVLLDGSGGVIWVNRAWRGYGREPDPVGEDYAGLMTGRVEEPYAGRIRAGIEGVLGAGPDGFSLEYPRHGEAELRWYSMYGTALEHEGRDYCLIVREDVTEQRVSELLTEARREEAATLNRILTHEVRNAVGSAIGWLRLLETAPDQADRVDRIAAALERIEEVVADSTRVLELVRGRPSFERVGIAELARAAWGRDDRGDVTLEFADRFPLVCYPRRTETLLESLFDSATRGSAVTRVRIRLGTREFHVEDDRSEPVPANPDRAFAETPLHRGGRLSFGLALARPLALLNGWRLSLGPSPLGGWAFTVHTDQPHV